MFDLSHIFQEYHASLFIYARKFVHDEAIALDLVQNVFMSVLEKKNLKQEEGQLKAYLFQAIRNRCFDHLRRRKIENQYIEQQKLSMMELKYYNSGERSLIERENLDSIYRAINSLSDIYKEIIELSRFEGLKNKEIAERLNLPLRTVETRLFRALSILKDKLSGKIFQIFMTFMLKQPPPLSMKFK